MNRSCILLPICVCVSEENVALAEYPLVSVSSAVRVRIELDCVAKSSKDTTKWHSSPDSRSEAFIRTATVTLP